MASSRRIGLNENISTYGDVSRDYQEGELSLWEQATDYDLVTAEVSETLKCYNDQDSFDDYDNLDGAITSALYCRRICVAEGQSHDGTPNNGFTFSCTSNVNLLYIVENYSQVQDIIGQLVIDSSNNRAVFYVNGVDGGFVGCIAFDSINNGVGSITDYFLCTGTTSFCINCLAYNNQQGSGFGSNTTNGYFYNCTAVGNITGFNSTGGTQIVKNCCSSGNTNDWSGTWSKITCTAEDASPSYVNPTNKDFHLAPDDTICKEQGTDLSGDAIYPFNDDIDGHNRSAPWDIGFDEKVLIPAGTYHEHYCNNIILTIVLPPPQEIYHEHRADTPIITDSMQNCYHRHTADNVILEQYVPGPHYLGIAIELPVIGPTQYQGYNFNSMIRFGDVYLGANSHGIYTLDTKDTDQDAQIRAMLKTMTTDLGIVNQKRIRKAYLGYEASGSLKLTVYDNDNNARTYTLTSTLVSQEQHSGEIPIDRNGKGRYWAFKIENVQGCDFSIDELSIIPLVLGRKP